MVIMIEAQQLQCLINIFMEVKRPEKMYQAEKIQLIPLQTQRQPNPQENATNNLLQISNQEYDFNDQRNQIQLQLKLQKISPPLLQKKQSQRKSSRISVAQNFTKSHKNWRKSSVNYLSGEQVCVMRKEKVINFSNFLVFENQDLNNLNLLPQHKFKLEQIDHPRPTFKATSTNKKFISFIRKRNLNYTKDCSNIQEAQRNSYSPNRKGRRVSSPIHQYNQSCQLRRQKQEFVKIEVDQPIVKEQLGYCSPDFRSTSPNFRNKKVVHYLKYRLNKNA